MGNLLYKKQRWRWLFRHRVYMGEELMRTAVKWYRISVTDPSVHASKTYFYFPREIVEWLNNLEGQGVLRLEPAYQIHVKSHRYMANYKFAVDFHQADHASLFKLAFHGRDFSSLSEEHQWCIVGELK